MSPSSSAAKVIDLTTRQPNNLESFWMPFTANRQYKARPRLFAGAKDMHYFTPEGRKVMDGSSGLWCVNAGHCREPIVAAVQAQVAKMDFAPTFQMGHPGAFEFASRLAAELPGDIDHVFFANSGSEAVDSALKIALAYHRARGEASRTRLIGRERGYHGVGFGGISVGGILPNRKVFSAALIPGVDHLSHTHNLEKNGFTKGQPEWGAHLADDLERLVLLHDASNIAAVIVEPMAGSTGVLVPPKGYLERLRKICDKHGILLIFDEVITGFGRLGTDFAASYFGVIPDLMTVAKGITNATVPMGAVFARKHVYDTIVNNAPPDTIELFHGYTYSAHPLACAAGLATWQLYKDEGLFAKAKANAPYLEAAVHSLKGLPHVIDIRNIGMVGAIELEPRPGKPGGRGYDALVGCFEKGLLTRITGDIIAVSPPLIAERSDIDKIPEILGAVLKTIP